MKKAKCFLKEFWLLHVLAILWVTASAVLIICVESVVVRLLPIIIIFLAGALEGIIFDEFYFDD